MPLWKVLGSLDPIFFGGGVEKDKGQLGSRFILGDYTTESYPSYDFNQLFAFQAIFLDANLLVCS